MTAKHSQTAKQSNDRIVTVIGGSGFLGSHAADKLSDAGFRVRMGDRADSPWKRADQEMITGHPLRSRS